MMTASVASPTTSQLSIQEQLLHRNVQRIRGGLVSKAHRLLYYSTLGLRVIKKKKRTWLMITASVAADTLTPSNPGRHRSEARDNRLRALRARELDASALAQEDLTWSIMTAARQRIH